MHIYLVPFLLQGVGRKPLKTSHFNGILLVMDTSNGMNLFFLALGTEMARSSKRFISVRQNTMDRHEKPMRNGNLGCNDASFSIFRRADMSWRTFARYLFSLKQLLGRSHHNGRNGNSDLLQFLGSGRGLAIWQNGKCCRKVSREALNHPH